MSEFFISIFGSVKAFIATIDIPAIVLLIILAMGWGIVKQAQKREDFDFSNMLRDDNNKESALRFAVFVALAVSSWFVIYDTIHNKAGDNQALLIYVVVWSGAKVAEKLVEALAAKWSK
jgi:hypothetical protein